LLYQLIKLPARLAFFLHCRHLDVNDRRVFKDSGPLLIASNHPNSFLDAILIATLFRKPVYSLARGDVFSNRLFRFLLVKLKILPVYRISEGAENLQENFTTFEKCREIFKKDGIVLIFSEGLCINEWHLRSLKKGTARLAIQSWEAGIPLRVLPLGINYQSFSSFGKNVILRSGTVIRRSDMDISRGSGLTIQAFNERLTSELKKLVIEIPDRNEKKIREVFQLKISTIEKTILLLPALAGIMIHAPLYFPFRNFIRSKALHSGHYDSILTGGLFLLYPFYTLLLTGILWMLSGSLPVLLLIPLMPILAWTSIRIKKQF